MVSGMILVFYIMLFEAVFSSDSSSKDQSLLKGKGTYSYDKFSNNGPANWHLIPGNELCRSGNSQSPIDFPHSTQVSELSFAPVPVMKASKYKLKSKANNWSLDCFEKATCGYTMYRGKKFFVAGLHIHTPSEHTLNGKQYPLEAHLVHQSEDGQLAVIATMFEYPTYSRLLNKKKQGKTVGSSFLKSLWKKLLKSKRTVIRMNVGLIVKRNEKICGYNGSLTTPPCSQNVQFFMQVKARKISREQVLAYVGSVGNPSQGNNRPIQKLNNRKITCYL